MSTTPNQKDLLAKKTDLEGILKPDANDILHLPDITITLAENGQFYLAGISKKLLTLIGNTNGNAVTLDGDAGLTFTTSGGSSTITGISDSSGNSSTIAASQRAVSAKQDQIIAGTNIQIAQDGKTISATDTNTLSDLTDTAISSLADGQVLKYNATSGKWVNGTGGSGGAEVILGTTAPTSAQGSNGNLYIQYDDTNNNTVTHEYVKISGAWEEIAIGGGGANLPNNYTVTADSLKIRNEAPSTGVDWIVENDTDYFDSEASITISTRVYQKTNAVPALGGVYTLYASGNTWTTIMFTSTDATAVGYSGNTDPFGSFTYLGHTWYFSGTEYALSGDHSSEVSGARYIGDFSQYDYSTKECCIEAAKRLIDYAGVSFEENNFTTISRPSTGYIIAGGGSASDFSDATFKVTKQGDIYSKGNLLEDIFQKKSQELTSSQYENLTLAEKTNGTIYFINDPVPGVRQLISRVSAADSHISASSSVSGYPPWAAFNGEDSGGRRNPANNTIWIPENGDTTPWIQYHFDNSYYLTKASLHIYSHYSSDGTGYQGNLYILGSNDGTNWDNISITGEAVTINTGPSATSDSGSGLATVVQLDFNLNNSQQYEYIRFQGDEAWNVYYGIACDFDDIYVYGTDQGSPAQKIYYMGKCYTNTGGGGGGGGTTTEEIYKNTAGTIPDTINLTKPINDFDIILISGFRSNTPTWKISSFYVSSAINQGDVIELNDDAYYAWYTVTDLSTLTKNVVAYDVIDTIYGLKLGSGGGGGNASAEEITLSEYNALTTEEKNDGTIRFIPKSNIGYGLDIDFTDSIVYKESGMSGTTVNNNSVQIVWDITNTYCGLTIYPTVKVNVTNYDYISYDFTSTNSYDSLHPGYENPVRDLGIGLSVTAPSTMTLAPNIDYTVWNRYEVTDVGITFTDERIDVSNLTGEYYLIIACAGWNATVSNIVIGTEGGNPSQIKYMDKTYGISSGSEGEGYTEEVIYSATPTTAAPNTLTLTKPYTDFDMLLFNLYRSADGVMNKYDRVVLTSKLSLNDRIQLITYNEWASYDITTTTSFTLINENRMYIGSVIGLKFGTGGGSSSKVNYSTTEQKVGTWIDGSDIYEKSFEVTITQTAPIIEQDASYIDALISYDAVVKNSLGYISGVGMDAHGWGFALHRNPSAQLLLYGNLSEAIGGKAYVTIRYTKVT